MARIDKDGNWIDPSNTPVPPKYIKPLDKKRDALVTRTFKRLVQLEAKIKSEKETLCSAVEAYLDDLARDNRVREGWRGNISIDSFDGTMRISRSIDDVIGFSEQLQMVKTLIDKWISTRLDGVDESLAVVIQGAFKVDKKGRINTAMLLKLLQYKIDEPEWKKAMKLLKDSITVKNTKQYYSFTLKSESSSRALVLSFNSAIIDGKDPTSKGQTEVADD
ncbi:MAG: DUF3164 family protein [Sphaerochaetaceae bacterium]